MAYNAAFSTLHATPPCVGVPGNWPTAQQLQDMAAAAVVVGKAAGFANGAGQQKGWEDIVREGASHSARCWNYGQVNQLIAELKALGAP
jgi:hypothetical protein